MKVISNKGSEYILLDLITKKEKHIHVTRIKEFLFAPSRVDPTDIARRDYLEFFVESVIAHRGNIKSVSSLEFLIKWQDYDASENTWEPWKNLRLLPPLHSYLRSHTLSYLVPKEFVLPRDP
jgi:Chromo (CHRromatin Organisation MOdifier) domain